MQYLCCMLPVFKIRKTKTGLYTWLLLAPNGQALAHGRNYTKREEAISACHSFIELAKKAEIDED